MEAHDNIDYSLYLVTDSSPLILAGRDLCDVVEKALEGGATVVQLREKHLGTAAFIDLGRRLHRVTRKHGVPLLINDRVDVALAVGCEGVHLGQDDLELSLARKLLGQHAIIGVSAGTVEEALTACRGGADYLGIGAVFATPTKTDTQHILGVSGVKDILNAVAEAGYGGTVRTVCIGGINESNIAQMFREGVAMTQDPNYSARDRETRLDGVAVVSAVMASKDPEAAARKLRALVPLSSSSLQGQPAGQVDRKEGDGDARFVEDIMSHVPIIIRMIREKKPISHNITNTVVQNFAANVALAMGASPIMTDNSGEVADICKLGGALVVNIGTASTPISEHDKYTHAITVYQKSKSQVVIDPVGAGATELRLDLAKTLLRCLDKSVISVIKGNEAEIRAVWTLQLSGQRGVDGSGSGSGNGNGSDGDEKGTLDDTQKTDLARQLARRHGAVVVMTGETDVVTDGARTVRIRNGHAMLGRVTGTGCALGTAMSAALAAVRTGPGTSSRDDDDVAALPALALAAVVAAMLHYEIAAERALELNGSGVRGPGTFVPAFLDELYSIAEETARGDLEWLKRARVEAVSF